MNINDLIKIGVMQKSYPQFLNKYRSDSDNTKKIITHNELWFANPLVFNDPYDRNTPINIHTPIDDIKKWLRSVGIHAHNIDALAARLKANPMVFGA